MGIIASRLSFLKRKKNNAADPAPAGTNTAQPAPLAGWKKGNFDGVTYNYLYIKPAAQDKPVFLLLHGFPNGAHPRGSTSYITNSSASWTLRSLFRGGGNRPLQLQGLYPSTDRQRIWRDPP